MIWADVWYSIIANARHKVAISIRGNLHYIRLLSKYQENTILLVCWLHVSSIKCPYFIGMATKFEWILQLLLSCLLKKLVDTHGNKESGSLENLMVWQHNLNEYFNYCYPVSSKSLLTNVATKKVAVLEISDIFVLCCIH